jgi:hypothetical protein
MRGVFCAIRSSSLCCARGIQLSARGGFSLVPPTGGNRSTEEKHMDEPIELIRLSEIPDWKSSPEWQQWLATHRIGCAKYDPEYNTITLDTGINSYRYEIDLDRCKTAKEFTHWMAHLVHKTWCRGSVITDFIRCLNSALEERHGKNMFGYFKVAGGV